MGRGLRGWLEWMLKPENGIRDGRLRIEDIVSYSSILIPSAT
jgi:hypothetical protein